jgi:hypothetical protein
MLLLHDAFTGNCGNGPSMVVLPEAIMLRHVNTPKDVADILAWQCKVDIPEALLRATEVRRDNPSQCRRMPLDV